MNESTGREEEMNPPQDSDEKLVAIVTDEDIEMQNSGSDGESSNLSDSDSVGDEKEEDDLVADLSSHEKEEDREVIVATKNEIVNPPLEEFPASIDGDVSQIGEVMSLVDCNMVIKAIHQGGALDIGTLVCTEDRTVLGKIDDVFGQVEEPMYTIRFNSTEELLAKGCALHQVLYFPPASSHHVIAANLRTKGSDASWKEDEEPPSELIEYSDDDMEKQVKSRSKAMKRGAKPNNNKSQKPTRGRGTNRGRGRGRAAQSFSAPHQNTRNPPQYGVSVPSSGWQSFPQTHPLMGNTHATPFSAEHSPMNSPPVFQQPIPMPSPNQHRFPVPPPQHHQSNFPPQVNPHNSFSQPSIRPPSNYSSAIPTNPLVPAPPRLPQDVPHNPWGPDGVHVGQIPISNPSLPQPPSDPTQPLPLFNPPPPQ